MTDISVVDVTFRLPEKGTRAINMTDIPTDNQPMATVLFPWCPSEINVDSWTLVTTIFMGICDRCFLSV